MNESYLTISDFAKQIARSPSAVAKWVADGSIPIIDDKIPFHAGKKAFNELRQRLKADAISAICAAKTVEHELNVLLGEVVRTDLVVQEAERVAKEVRRILLELPLRITAHLDIKGGDLKDVLNSEIHQALAELHVMKLELQ